MRERDNFIRKRNNLSVDGIILSRNGIILSGDEIILSRNRSRTSMAGSRNHLNCNGKQLDDKSNPISIPIISSFGSGDCLLVRGG